MDDQDLIDTAPVPREGSITESRSAVMLPTERLEIVLDPPEPMQDPTLFLSLSPRDDLVVVEGIAHGRITIIAQETSAES